MSTEGKKIAVTGKGGSGKTVLSALMTKLLSSRKELKVLAIDADSTLSLPYTLGIPIGKTVGDLRQSMIEDPEVKADVKSKHIREVMAEILETGKGFQILTMGRPEGPGCYCSVNDLLKYGIDTLCEAGPEQVNRRVVQGLDVLIIVTDPTMRGMQAARVINQVAQTHESTQTALVINKVRDDIGVLVEKARDWDLNVLGCLPADDNIAEYDLSGRPILGLPNDSPAVVAVQEILQSLGL
jgi:CO dehydrogenase maturation factor